MFYQTFESFYPRAAKLRAVYDENLREPLEARRERFVWDYWHVPGQYTLLRTPAHAYFAKKVYEPFHRHLVEWGRANLGCHDVSPPWLSCYVEGCRQEMHSDVPHGPLAFVFSLTRRQGFSGGETFLLRSEALDSAVAQERRQMVKTIAPTFNRLLVFDPSIPHGVNEVRGTHDPREGRLVIHGWFVNPRPFWYGPLTVREVRDGIEEGLAEVLAGGLNLGRGLLSVQLKVLASGRVAGVEALVSTLRDADPRDLRRLGEVLKTLAFAKKARGTRLTLPLLIT